MPETDTHQTESTGQRNAARQTSRPSPSPGLSALRDWLGHVMRTGHVLLFVLAGMLIWWAILAAVGDAAAARAAGLACLIVSVLWLVHGVLLSILLARAVLTYGLDASAALPAGLRSNASGQENANTASHVTSSHPGSAQQRQAEIDPDAETVRSSPGPAGSSSAASVAPSSDRPPAAGETTTVSPPDSKGQPGPKDTAEQPDAPDGVESSRWDLLPEPVSRPDSSASGESDTSPTP